MTSPPYLHLSPEAIDRVVENLRQRGGDHISRGRGGDGFGYKDGVFYNIYVEDCDQIDTPFASEAAFRAALAQLNFEDNTDRYRHTVVRSLGGNPTMDPCDPAAVARDLKRHATPQLVQPLPWRCAPNHLTTADGSTFARLTPPDHPAPVWLELPPATLAALQAQGVTPQDLLHRRLVVPAIPRADRPSPGHIALLVVDTAALLAAASAP